MSFLTPGFFNALVLIVAVVGLILAGIRIRNDFRKGPRWTDNSPFKPQEPQQPKDLEELKHD